MYDQLAKVRDEKEAAARPGGQDWNGTNTAGRPRIILVSRRLPYKLQASVVVVFRLSSFVSCLLSFVVCRLWLFSAGGRASLKAADIYGC